jgi:hypothetical protein
MKQRTQFRKKHTDSKIKISGRIYILLVVIMFGIVIRDSFIHDLPFYYILYTLFGSVIGHLVGLTQKVVITEDQKTLSLKVKPIGMILTILLLLIRYFAGTIILEEFNVIWATDAIYLLFIGIYFSKVKNMMKQIDEHVYKYIFENK